MWLITLLLLFASSVSFIFIEQRVDISDNFVSDIFPILKYKFFYDLLFIFRFSYVRLCPLNNFVDIFK
jgi:hypothetical protein